MGGEHWICFDFAYCYPASSSLSDRRETWRTFSELLLADPKNRNNRFEMAGELNERGGCNFWGKPLGKRYESISRLSRFKSALPYPSMDSTSEFRVIERRLKVRGFQTVLMLAIVWEWFGWQPVARGTSKIALIDFTG